jgi:predicted N-acetyltransferase YhbS
MTAGFSSGIASLDNYFHNNASRDQRHRIAAVLVLRVANGNTVIGFYTLSSTSVQAAYIPQTVRRKWGSYREMPATLLGRLAVDTRFRGQRYGEALLANALQRAALNEIASVVVTVDALDEAARGFYEKYGFRPLLDHDLRLYLPMVDIPKLR